MNMNPNDTFEITGNDRFKAKASAVFAFDQVTLRSTSTPSDPPASTPATTDNTNTPCVLPPEDLAGHASDQAGAKRVRTDDFKGRESLFRVPDNEWDGPRARPTRANEALDLRRILELRQNSRTRGGHSDPLPRETFRRPANPRPRAPRAPRSHHRVPDFKRNPDKYQKYTLKDVDLTSNRGNSQAAFAFLDEIKNRKRKSDDHFGKAEENEQERQMRESGQIQFKPRCSQTSSSTTPSPTSSWSTRSSSTSSESQRAKASSSSTGREAKKHKPTMMLSHLMEDEEEEQEEQEEEDGEDQD